MSRSSNCATERPLPARAALGLVLLALLLASCAGAVQLPGGTAASPTPYPPRRPSRRIPARWPPRAAPAVSPTPSAVPGPLPAPNYTLSATYDYAARTLAGQEQIVYANRSGEPIAELLLVVDALIYPGSFQLGSLRSSAGPAVTATTWEKTWLHAAPGAPAGPRRDRPARAGLHAAAARAQRRGGAAPDGLWLVRAPDQPGGLVPLPAPLPGAGKGWWANPPGYYGEHQVYEASDFDVNLQVANAPDGLVAAASAPETLENGWRHYQLNLGRSFAISLSPAYKVTTRSAGDTTVTGYTFPGEAAAGERAVQTAAESVELFSRLYAPLEHKHLAVVEADFLDGMEYDGLFFLSQGFYNLYNGASGEYLVTIAAHETSHQWWYGLVGNDQALQPWLDEALATYSEKLYYENVAPDGLTWWWEARVKFYNPRGLVDDSIYNPHHEAEAYRAYRDAVYLNGAIFLDELRTLVGDEAFFAFLKDYVAQNRNGIADSAKFFAILKKHTTVDIAPLVKKYFGQE